MAGTSFRYYWHCRLVFCAKLPELFTRRYDCSFFWPAGCSLCRWYSLFEDSYFRITPYQPIRSLSRLHLSISANVFIPLTRQQLEWPNITTLCAFLQYSFPQMKTRVACKLYRKKAIMLAYNNQTLVRKCLREHLGMSLRKSLGSEMCFLTVYIHPTVVHLKYQVF